MYPSSNHDPHTITWFSANPAILRVTNLIQFTSSGEEFFQWSTFKDVYLKGRSVHGTIINTDGLKPYCAIFLLNS